MKISIFFPGSGEKTVGASWPNRGCSSQSSKRISKNPCQSSGWIGRIHGWCESTRNYLNIFLYTVRTVDDVTKRRAHEAPIQYYREQCNGGFLGASWGLDSTSVDKYVENDGASEHWVYFLLWWNHWRF